MDSSVLAQRAAEVRKKSLNAMLQSTESLLSQPNQETIVHKSSVCSIQQNTEEKQSVSKNKNIEIKEYSLSDFAYEFYNLKEQGKTIEMYELFGNILYQTDDKIIEPIAKEFIWKNALSLLKDVGLMLKELKNNPNGKG